MGARFFAKFFPENRQKLVMMLRPRAPVGAARIGEQICAAYGFKQPLPCMLVTGEMNDKRLVIRANGRNKSAPAENCRGKPPRHRSDSRQHAIR